ncbi:MAG: DNA repair protein RecN [Firmicutes bacterium]|nr:DNA repair protein RecN [Bacillota bacterium]
MITHISIKDFAIIKDLELDLHPGLNIITGETGAGKSIVIEAVSMALGSRADTDFIRTGADKACITLTADPEGLDVSAELEEAGVPADEPLVIRREISAGRKSLCRVNGTIVPLSFLGRLCRHLADIHGQYDTQTLLNPDGHVDVLDLYGGSDLGNVVGMVRGFYTDMTRTASALTSLRNRLADSERQKDLARYEVQEIDAAGVQPGEDETLEEEIRLMQNSENIYQTLSQIYDAVYDSDDSASGRLGSCLSALEGISSFSKDLGDAAQQFSDAYYALDDLGRDLRRLRDSISFSPEELEEKTERLDLLEKLKRKYGGSLEAILAYRDKAAQELQTIENADAELEDLESKLKLYKEQYETAAARLSVLRKRTAKTLEEEVDRELADLNFADAALSVSIEDAPASEKGSDRVEFLIRTNKGEAFKPLAKIASGGELSRIMLAMKRIIGDLDEIPTMIFDEIDAGISGATAGVVGEKLRSIAEDHQIVCITHLPQIAALGDHHFRIQKTSDEISTQTTVVPLSEAERVEELARLLSGTVVTESARQQARELLKH